MRSKILGSGRATMVAVVTLLAVASVAGLTLIRTDADKTTMFAYFEDASPLIVGNDVKLKGVKVGVIDSIEVKDGKAKVGLRLEKAARPIHRDASATVRPAGLLGERYVDLDLGKATSPQLPIGGSIPTSQTGGATDLDEVLNTIDQPTGTALAALATTLGEGLRGTGSDLNEAIKALKPAMQDTGQLVALLDDQSAVLTELIDSLEPLTGAVAADQGKSLDKLIGAADTLLGATAKNQGDLDQTLAQLPGALVEARRTLRGLTAAAKATTPNLKAMRPTTDKLVQLSEELTAFSKVADPALKGLDPVLVQGRALIENARPVAAALRRAGPDLSGTARGARPVAEALLGNLRNVLDFVKFWALTTNGEDGLSHYFRAHIVISTELATGPVPASPSSHDAPKSLLPGLPSLPGLGELPLVGDLPLLGGQQTQGSATGLTSQQENSLLDSLLGGN